MCLIAVAHLASDRHPFVLAANRDEDYGRPSHAADFWPDAPEVVGGRDAVAGGSWLALRGDGRFAAVTNLAHAPRKARSRGELVREFVLSDVDALEYVQSIDPTLYAGFHLLAGVAGRELVYERPLSAGIYAISNAPAGQVWPKMTTAAEAMGRALTMADPGGALMRFLAEPRNSGAIESEVFIRGERYGTRSSTVIVATNDEIVFTEQNYARGGIVDGPPRTFRIARSGS